MNTLHALVLAFILWGGIIAAAVGALRHLMRRPHLTGEQKVIALLVSSVITVPVCGLLYFPILFLSAVLLPFGNFSVGEEALSSAVFLGPLVLIIGLVTVQTCGDLGTIRPLVEGQPSTEFPLQTVSVPSNVNSYSGWASLSRAMWRTGAKRVGRPEPRTPLIDRVPLDALSDPAGIPAGSFVTAITALLSPYLDFVHSLDTWPNRRTSCCGWPTEIFHCRG